jgi:hypothetical protein
VTQATQVPTAQIALAHSGVAISMMPVTRTMDEQERISELLSANVQRQRLYALTNCGEALTPSAKILHTVLNLLAGNDHDHVQWPGNKPVARLIGIEHHGVKRAMLQLIKAGLVSFDTKELIPSTIIKLHLMDDIPKVSSRKKTLTISDEPKSTGSTADELALILKDHVNMGRYIRFGIDGIRNLTSTSIRSTHLDWQSVPGWTKENPQPQLWSMQQCMGYYWFLLSWRRDHEKIELTLPNWGRLAANLGKLQLPPDRIYKEIVTVFSWWPLINAMSQTAGILIPLDEGTLIHKVTQSKILTIRGMSDDQRNALYQQIVAGAHGGSHG